MEKNAIIMAAGKSDRFAPFSYEKPKGLFIVRGEVLIERQIEQLLEAGVNEIYVVIGYMKEKFFYLEQKYPQVKLVINNTYGKYGNIYSLYVTRKYLKNTFICCADHYFLNNPQSHLLQIPLKRFLIDKRLIQRDLFLVNNGNRPLFYHPLIEP